MGPSNQTMRIFLYFSIGYILLTLYVRTRTVRDPGSLFFDPWTAYDPSYSAYRLGQGEAYIDSISNSSVHPVPKAGPNPEICLGIATVARKGIRYFHDAVGTVLEGLSAEERANIYLILFIAHTEPARHPAYQEKWLYEVPDKVLLYQPDKIDMQRIQALEKDTENYLMRACNDVGTKYLLLMEDDVVAQDGWYHRTREALAIAEKKTEKLGASKWLYLRLFYSEEFFGWNSEEWPTYLWYSILAIVVVALVSLGSRQYIPSVKPHMPNSTVLLLCFVCTPLLIILFFAAGRTTMLPLPKGVHLMQNFGCCSQAFVFPRERVPELLELYKSKEEGYVDSITEAYANEHDELRWALIPSVMQHVGRQSTKSTSDTVGPPRYKTKAEMKGPERLWNFAFETIDPAAMSAEHEYAKEDFAEYVDISI
ncbi:hypothetical protein N7468_010602 [Penicillium chermesinum]|uniref:Integral membrane protein n=1 Tax=Penicillium chermesinum TaxID=63820 RepID=A0A9W9T9V8_9EURO|nr:uncharacterized protein N7468_010602 [Penicillium chermesinum]KAJ5214923.1 hypothetical protein N7468_010602 [Penicillium chermesinum]KAJ6141573.1 hypothetical protein N7470_009963 [Penicillium chermesinum]